MLADSIIEKGKIILRNLNINAANTAKDVWTSGLTGYGFYTVSYETPLVLGHTYYLRFTYKFTTTNQSPTWVTFYLQGGMHGGPGASGMTAGTEYTRSGLERPTVSTNSYTITSGTLYNGNSNAINGVTSYAKNVLIYDITELYTMLLAYGLATDDATVKTWCDNNLDFVPRYTNYDITSKFSENSNKVFIKGGHVIAKNFIECDGMQYYLAHSDLDRYFDSGTTQTYVYNNKNNGTVTHTRVSAADQNSPFYPEHKYVLKITTNGEASPGAGGLVLDHRAAANKIFVEKIVAKIPVGYSIQCHYNPQGDGASVGFISATAGTGDWAEYTVLYKCGSSGSFSSGGHLALYGSNNTSVTWYVAYVSNCEITGKEYLKYYTALPSKYTFKDGNVYDYDFDTANVLPNGDASDNAMSLPSGWTYDDTDYAGNAKRSFVQPVGKGAGCIGPKFKIDPAARYKVSYWVKCKQDMSSFLTAIRFWVGNAEITHTDCQYVSGTKTKLARALNQGDTTVYLNSANNWVVRSHSRLGFRNNEYTSCYNDKYTYRDGSGADGVVSAVDTNNKTITLRAAYAGTAMPAGTVIVESFDGGTYPYPIQKGSLPTDNTWKYVTGYFGVANGLSDGAGGGWGGGIPSGVREAQLYINIYNNNGSVPIKYSDIRIEQVSIADGSRVEGKIQFKKHN